MQRLAVVVLNYNDYENTEAQVERILHYECINHIIVVDNCSSDESAEKLEKRLLLWNEAFSVDKVRLRRAKRNGGYGAGNNLGMREAEKLGMDYVLIANPDVSFSEEVPKELLRCFEREIKKEKELRLGVLSCRMVDKQGGLQQTAWRRRGFYGELMNSAPLLRRVFWRFLNYPKGCFGGGEGAFKERNSRIKERKSHKKEKNDFCGEHHFAKERDTFTTGAEDSERTENSRLENSARNEAKQFIKVGVVHGSLLMLSMEAFRKSGGFDERVFLYCEENILAARMEKAGFSTGLLPDIYYLHENGGSTEKSYSAVLPRQRIRQSSERYYYKHYLHIKPIQQLLCLLVQGIVLMETAVCDWLRKREIG